MRCRRERVTWLLWKEKEASKAEQERGQAGTEQKPSGHGDGDAADLLRMGFTQLWRQARLTNPPTALLGFGLTVCHSESHGRLGVPQHEQHHTSTQAAVSKHKAEQGGYGGPGRRHNKGVLAPWRSASCSRSLWPGQRQPWQSWENYLVLQVLFLPLVPPNLWNCGPKNCQELAQHQLSASSSGATAFQQHSSPAAHQPPHWPGRARGWPRKPHGWPGQQRECSGTCAGKVLNERPGSAAAGVVCLHLEQGALGNGATSTAPQRACWGTGKIRDSRKLQARALSCGLGADFFSTCLRRGQVQASAPGPNSGSSPVLLSLCQQHIFHLLLHAPGPAQQKPHDAICSLVTSTGSSAAPARETRGTAQMLNWHKAGMKTQPTAFKSGEVSLLWSPSLQPQLSLLPALRLL